MEIRNNYNNIMSGVVNYNNIKKNYEINSNSLINDTISFGANIKINKSISAKLKEMSMNFFKKINNFKNEFIVKYLHCFADEKLVVDVFKRKYINHINSQIDFKKLLIAENHSINKAYHGTKLSEVADSIVKNGFIVNNKRVQDAGTAVYMGISEADAFNYGKTILHYNIAPKARIATIDDYQWQKARTHVFEYMTTKFLMETGLPEDKYFNAICNDSIKHYFEKKGFNGVHVNNSETANCSYLAIFNPQKHLILDKVTEVINK